MKNWVKSGSPWIWLTAGSVAVSLLALIGILLLLAGQGMRYFWPSPVYQFELNQNGAGPVTVIGELYQQQSISRRQLAEAGVTPPGEAQSVERYLIKVGNREREGQDFRTLLASDIRSQSTPRGLLVLERDSHGTAYGYLAGLLEDGQPLTGRNLGQALQQRLPQIAALSRRAHDIQFRDMARINQQFDALRLREKRLQRDDKLDARAQDAIKAERLELQRQYQLLSERGGAEPRSPARCAAAARHAWPDVDHSAQPVRDARYPNAMNTTEKLAHWGEQVKKFLTDSPREANTEGGVFPAIFGTVLMVILMSIVVMPFGVIAAVYLHEYAGNNLLTRVIRIAVVNGRRALDRLWRLRPRLFVYMIGGTLDQLFYPESLPNPTFGTPGVLWAALTLALLTLPVVIVATEEGLSRIPTSLRQGSMALGPAGPRRCGASCCRWRRRR